jgi:hypothetical protein
VKLTTHIFDTEATREENTVPYEHTLVIHLQSLTEFALRNAMDSVSILIGTQVPRRFWSEGAACALTVL